MAVEVKVAPDERLEYISVFLEDRRTLSQYFNLTEYPDTLTGGKNAFLIAGTDYLEPNTEVQIQIRDSKGNVVYTESSDGSPTEYYEGISKVVAAYVYPNDSVLQAKDATAYGPCTITILGELKYYDNNGSKTEVPEIWKGKYNVRWIGTANINPALANTTRVRFFYRPQATITEILKPIYNVSGTSITASAITASYANIRLTRLETFAGDVKRVKVYRTSQGTVSDFELIQDILIESKELLQTFDATGSVITDTGVFDSQIFQKFWNSGSLNASLNSTQFSGSFAAKLTGSGNFTYTSSLDLSDKTTYELSFDGFYTSSTQSSLKVHISGSQNGDLVVDTLTGLIPTKNFTNYITQFTIPKQEPTASLYFSQTQGDWYLKDISLRAAQDTAFSPNEVSFIVSMPTNISNETFNFKFEFFDVNNNFIPVSVTGSQTFTGGNDNLTTIATTVSGLSSSFDGSLTALSQSVSGTISFTSQSVSGSLAIVSSSLSSSILTSYSSSIYTLQTLADGNYSGSFISGSLIYAPEIGGQTGFISGKFTVGKPPNSIVLDATTSTRRIYIGTGTYNNTNTPIYLDSDGKFSLKDKLTFDGTNLSVNGTINVTGGNAATQTYASSQATTAYNNATSQLQLLADGGYSGSFIGSTTIYSPNIGGQNGYISNIFKVGSSAYDQIVLDASGTTRKIYIGSGTWDADNTGFYVDSAGYFSLKRKLTWNNTTLNITGNINASSISGGTITIGTGFAVDANGNVTATNANLTGTVNATAGQFGSGTNYWKIGASTIENNITTNGKVSLNAARPAIEVYDSSGVLKVDINGGSTFTDPGGGGSLNPGSYGGNASVSTNGNVATGASGASFQSFGQTPSVSSVPYFDGVAGKTATIKITASGAAGSSNVVGSPVYGNNISLTYGFLIKTGSATGTTIATVSEAITNGTGQAGANSLGSYNKEFTTTIVLSAVRYYIVPFVERVFIQAFTSGEGGGGSITELTGTVYTPQIASSNVSFEVGKTEIIAGGIQIIRSTSAYFKVDRAGSGDIVLIGGNASVTGSVSITGDLTANTSSDIRLKTNIQRIPNPMDKILKISGNTFEWLSGFDEIHKHSGNDVGVIAQEIESVLPEIVVTRDNGYKGVHYEKLVALLIEGMKELQSQIDELKNNK